MTSTIRTALLGITLLLPLLTSLDIAAQTYKCLDASGKVTYSGRACSELGLKDAGEVRDRINTAPAYRAPERAPAPPAKAAAKAPVDKAADAAKATEPERRCFTVKTGTGTATRCNDKPEEDKPSK